MACRFHRSVERTKRGNVWASIDLSPAMVAADTVVLLSFLTAGFLLLRPFTVIRTYLEVSWQSDQSAVTENPHGAFGMVQVTDQAVTAGIASIPDPLLDGDAAWYVWQGLQTQFTFKSASGIDGDAGSRYSIDSKAMRKIGPNQNIAIVAVNSNTVHGADIGVKGRFLVKLL